MKTTFILSVTLLIALPLVGTAQAQDLSGQQDPQPVSAANSASPATSANSGYGGVAGSTSATGNVGRADWTRCGHLPKCNPDSGH